MSFLYQFTAIVCKKEQNYHHVDILFFHFEMLSKLHERIELLFSLYSFLDPFLLSSLKLICFYLTYYSFLAILRCLQLTELLVQDYWFDLSRFKYVINRNPSLLTIFLIYFLDLIEDLSICAAPNFFLLKLFIVQSIAFILSKGFLILKIA